MNETFLSLIFVDKADPKYIYIQDVSEYNSDLDVSNPLLAITPPNFSTSYVVAYPVSSIIPINSNALGWTDTTNYNELGTLSDGLWKFKQSVEPNDCVYKTHYHFRIVNLKQSILDYVSEQLDYTNPNCTLNDAWYQDIFNMLQLLESAKYLAENCEKFDQAAVIYNQVKNAFKKYACESC